MISLAEIFETMTDIAEELIDRSEEFIQMAKFRAPYYDSDPCEACSTGEQCYHCNHNGVPMEV